MTSEIHHRTIAALRRFRLLVPLLLAVYAIGYGRLSGAAEGQVVWEVVPPLLAAVTLLLFRHEPALTVFFAAACWSITGSAVFVIATAYLLARRQPTFWWAYILAFVALFPAGLVPAPQYFEAGFALLPTAIVPVYSTIAPALVGLLQRALGDARNLELSMAKARAATAVVEERLRVSRELHDIVGQRLSGLVLQAGAIEATTREAKTAEMSRELQESGRVALEDLHYVLRLLRSRNAVHCDTRDPADVIGDAIGRGQTVVTRHLEDLQGLPPATLRVVTAVMDEALHNAAKYAPNVPVTIVAARPSNTIQVVITNPVGTPVMQLPSGGFGLDAARERVEEFDGRFCAGITEDGGFAVEITLPGAP